MISLASEGLLHPINWENVPNAALIDDLFKADMTPRASIRCPTCGARWASATTTMVDDPVDSWDIL